MFSGTRIFHPCFLVVVVVVVAAAVRGAFTDTFFSPSVRLPLQLLFTPPSLFFIEKQNSLLTKYFFASKRQTVHVVVIALN